MLLQDPVALIGSVLSQLPAAIDTERNSCCSKDSKSSGFKPFIIDGFVAVSESDPEIPAPILQ